MNSLKGLAILGAATAAVIPAAASAQLAGSGVQIEDSTPTFTLEGCEIARGKLELTGVQSRNGIYPMSYRFNCSGTPVTATFSQHIPQRDIKTLTVDLKTGATEYTYTASYGSSQPSYSRPQSSWAPVSRPQPQPQIDPMRDPACFSAMSNVHAIGSGATVSVGQWTKTGSGLCYRNR